MSILRSPLALEASRQILDALDQAPRAIAELPRRWPVTRALLRVCLADLEARGELRIEGVGARRVVHRVRTAGKAATRATVPAPSGDSRRRTAA